MTVFRWIIFLPVGALVYALIQAIATSLAAISPWMIFVIIFFGILVVVAGMAPVKIAPDKKIGAAILLTIFIPLEIYSLWLVRSDHTWWMLAGRVFVDGELILGAIVAVAAHQGKISTIE